MKLSRFGVAVVVVVASTPIVTPGCSQPYTEIYTCEDYIRLRKTSWGVPDPCCEAEPLCESTTIANLSVCLCRRDSCTKGTKLKMECSTNAMATTCECFKDDVSLGSCQEAGGYVCSALFTCCNALFGRNAS